MLTSPVVYNGKTLLICGFPGVGKTYLWNELRLPVTDSDSSRFRKGNFPENYVNHIKGILTNNPDNEIILISTHDIVRNELRNQKLSKA